jgi:hypothetical protein
MKLPLFGLNVRLLFTDLFRLRIRIRFRIHIRIRIQNVYFGSGSDPDPAKSFGSLRIRIRNTDWQSNALIVCLNFMEVFLIGSKILIHITGNETLDPSQRVLGYGTS